MVTDVSFPATIRELLDTIDRDQECGIIAGGTDLVVAMKEGKVEPKRLVSLSGIPDMKMINASTEGLTIGAAATHQSVATEPAIMERYTAISEGAGQIGSWQVRNLATVGGNLCSAVPSADVAPPLLAFCARVKLASATGERTVPLEEFFVGPMQTVLAQGELMTEILVPQAPPRTGSCYLKLGPRGAMDIAWASVAAVVSMDGETCGSAGLSLGAVAPTPLKVKAAECVLLGTRLVGADIEQAASIAAECSRPISDHRASADYRRKMVSVLAKRALTLAFERAKSSRGRDA